MQTQGGKWPFLGHLAGSFLAIFQGAKTDGDEGGCALYALYIDKRSPSNRTGCLERPDFAFRPKKEFSQYEKVFSGPYEFLRNYTKPIP